MHFGETHFSWVLFDGILGLSTSVVNKYKINSAYQLHSFYHNDCLFIPSIEDHQNGFGISYAFKLARHYLAIFEHLLQVQLNDDQHFPALVKKMTQILPDAKPIRTKAELELYKQIFKRRAFEMMETCFKDTFLGNDGQNVSYPGLLINLNAAILNPSGAARIGEFRYSWGGDSLDTLKIILETKTGSVSFVTNRLAFHPSPHSSDILKAMLYECETWEQFKDQATAMNLINSPAYFSLQNVGQNLMEIQDKSFKSLDDHILPGLRFLTEQSLIEFENERKTLKRPSKKKEASA